jgi:hypothetical protein
MESINKRSVMFLLDNNKMILCYKLLKSIVQNQESV